MLNAAGGHARESGLIGVLNTCNAAGALDFYHAQRAVIEPSGQYNPDHQRVMLSRSGTEQRIDGRPGVVFPRAAREQDAPVIDEHVLIGWSDINSPGSNHF